VIENAISTKYEWHFLQFDDFVTINAINRDDSIKVIDSINDTRSRRFEARVRNLPSPTALE
jgi:hypothetical protein